MNTGDGVLLSELYNSSGVDTCKDECQNNVGCQFVTWCVQCDIQ